ncbi:MAG TPA: protein kinase [Vicinamibacterales bacterium]|nr:protein kinase [Vicinamibacterales bacterium]
MTPSTIAHYRISEKIGEGAMGEVYRATDSKLGREVAIKMIPEDFARDASRMSRFTREAQVLASLNHPNIAAIYGVEDRALIMELVEGQTLADRIKQGAIPLDEALEFAKQIASGIEAAHEKGIVHRDLKPSNIKITPSGTIKLLDFGLAKAEGPWAPVTPVDETPTLTVASTGAGVILGTAAYMAPEQARGRNVDKRADVWAFGVVVYEMLTGKPLFPGESVTDVLAAVVRQDVDLSEVPAKVRPLLRRCLEKDPKRRLRDVADAMLLLEPTPDESAAALPVSRAPVWALAGATAVLLVALATLAWIHFREVPPTAEVTRFQMGLPDNARFTSIGASTISPDGRKIVFSAYGADGAPRVWIRTFDSAAAVPLEDARTSQVPFPFFWSPDSRFIAFEGGGRLRKIPVEGGTPQAIAEAPKSFGGQWVLGGSWNRDNVIIIGTSNGIMRVSADGGGLTPVTQLTNGELGHIFPTFLPDGRHFVYLRGPAPGSRFIALGDLDAKPDAQSTTPILKTDFAVVAVPASPDGRLTLLFQRDTTVLAQEFDATAFTLRGEPAPIAEQVASFTNGAIGFFSASNTGTLIYRSISEDVRQLTWFDREGQAVGTPGGHAPYGIVKVSPDGTKAAVVLNVDLRVRPPNNDVWIVDLIKGGSTRLTFDPATDTNPVWSPDGKWVAWQSNRDKEFELFRKAADGSGIEERLRSSKPVSNLTDWSRNGYLIYSSMGDLWALPEQPDAAGNRTPVAVVNSPANEYVGYVSPDNRWIAYLSTETGQQEMFVQSFNPAGGAAVGKWQVSERGTMGVARWRSDSKELMFVGSDGSILAVDVAPGGAFQASAPHKLFQVPFEILALAPNPGQLIDVTRDHQRLLVPMPVPSSAQREVSVVVNWPTALRK